MLKIVSGLLKPSSGIITLNDEVIRSRSKKLRKISSYVHQSPVLLNRSVCENIKYNIEKKENNANYIKQKVNEMMQLAEIHEKKEEFKLSGGEIKRVAIVRAFASSPDILILDEPTAEIDPGGIEMIKRIIAMQTKGGKAVLFSTHNMAFAGEVELL